jgi:putative nucleotidyltransferase with HDIG domain
LKPLESYYNFDKEVLKAFEKLKQTPQSKIHHAEGNVYLHTSMVLSEVEKIQNKYNEKDFQTLIYTALFHDIAKPQTTIFEDGDYHAPGHAKLGERIFRELMWQQFNLNQREEIAALIRFHGLPKWFSDKENPEMAVIGASLRCNLAQLADFSDCDFKGRICKDLDEQLFQIELFREMANELGCLNSSYNFTSDWARLHYFKKGGYCGKEIWEPTGPWFVVLAGLPGSGKNTWIKNNWSGNIVELDVIRKKEKISANDKKGQGKIQQLAKEEIRIHLRKQEPVLFNATNLTNKQRSVVIDLALQYNAKIKIVYIDCSYELALERNETRNESEQIQKNKIKKMYRILEIPTIAECHQLEFVKI